MTYVLLYMDCNKRPCYIQGSVAEINEKLRNLWVKEFIDPEDWQDYEPWQMLGIEDGVLSPVNRVECNIIPQFNVI